VDEHSPDPRSATGHPQKSVIPDKRDLNPC
jgi:hypothetical protein